ncbi:hypothetical protein ABZN20_00155 [Methylococcus sp. ANG]|uniref:hypothetical protein n=1 Tax=unclassified Methylococcus TaxID=2618889 RepID=UPI001C52D877|nr:hypothetical protein [Methylococcus sp. Mc7]QXP83113.1 hypothetical protein KW115_13045 [Methylococcus sp. Mc7]
MTKRIWLPAVLATAFYGGSGIAAEDAPSLQERIERQRAENEALKAKIARIEQVLKTDVCSNPEAAKLLEPDEAAGAPVKKGSGAPK